MVGEVMLQASCLIHEASFRGAGQNPKYLWITHRHDFREDYYYDEEVEKEDIQGVTDSLDGLEASLQALADKFEAKLQAQADSARERSDKLEAMLQELLRARDPSRPQTGSSGSGLSG